MSLDELDRLVKSLENKLENQELRQATEVKALQSSADELRQQIKSLEDQRSGPPNASIFTTKAEWTVESSKIQSLGKGESVFSPVFNLAGVKGLQLEVYPKGREKTTPGFCSLFLWCEGTVKVTYQLFVGSVLRSPDTDEYVGRIGHGHSNFCTLAPELKDGSLCCGVEILEVSRPTEYEGDGMRLCLQTPSALVANAATCVANRTINRVVWKIQKISQRICDLPKGTSMWSPPVQAAGVSELMMEFYPNGNTNTTKDGFCAFYIRCPDRVEMLVTLFVGKTRKGKIKTVFDSQSGKGLPDFCFLCDEINRAEDSLELGLELQMQPQKTLLLES